MWGRVWRWRGESGWIHKIFEGRNKRWAPKSLRWWVFAIEYPEGYKQKEWRKTSEKTIKLREYSIQEINEKDGWEI